MGSSVHGQIAIGIPVRNEARRLTRLLDALARQTVGPGAFTACFLLDGCTDQSATILSDRAGSLPFEICTGTLPRSAPNAGRARAAAMRLCLSQLGPAEKAFLLTTTINGGDLWGLHWNGCSRLFPCVTMMNLVGNFLSRQDHIAWIDR